jgi:hypothetical protein
LVERGLSIYFLAGLVRSGLVSATAERIGLGPDMVFAYRPRSADCRPCGLPPSRGRGELDFGPGSVKFERCCPITKIRSTGRRRGGIESTGGD